MDTNVHLTAVFENTGDGYIAYIEEIPGVNTQGDTLEETRQNLAEALELVISVRREMAEEQLKGKIYTKENFRLGA